MALPVILVNSAGSDAATFSAGVSPCSGAGPSTPIGGSTAASAADGLSVIVDALTDISGVATDGSAVFYFADATAGNRNFSKITGSSGSGGATPTFTLAHALGFSLTKVWGVGGKRASIAGTISKKLFDNNSTAGDAMPGWVVEMQSGYTETIAATFDLRRAGDTTTGPIILRGAAGGTRPILTFSNDGNCFVTRGAYQQLRFFEMRNSGGSTASVAITLVSNPLVVDDIKCSHATNKFWKFFLDGSASGGFKIVNCEIGNTVSFAIVVVSAGNTGGITIENNWIYNSGGNAINLLSNGYFSCNIKGNIIYNTTGIGINYDNSRADILGGGVINENTVDLSSSDAIKIVTSAASLIDLNIINNILSNNGGYGLNFAAAGHTDALLAAYAPLIFGNQTYLNTSGAYKSNTGTYTNSNCPWASGDSGLNPTYGGASSGNFALGTPLKAQGFPLAGTRNVGTGSSTPSYVDPGAAQRVEPSSSPNIQSQVIQNIGTY